MEARTEENNGNTSWERQNHIRIIRQTLVRHRGKCKVPTCARTRHLTTFVDKPMAYYYDPLHDSPPRSLHGFWTANKGAVLVKTAHGRELRREVEPAGLVTFQEAAALIRRNGKPVSREAVYQWAKAGKFRVGHIPPRSGVRKVAVIRLSELRKFAERYGFECLPQGR